MPNPAQPDADIVAGHFSQTNQGEAKHVTSKDDGSIDTSFIKEIIVNLETADNIDGSGNPVPVRLTSEGFLAKSDARFIETAKFFGFVKDSFSIVAGDYVGDTGVNTSTTFSHTVTAGSNVLLVVSVSLTSNSGVPTGEPSSVTWNGSALTKAVDQFAGNSGASIWYLALGNVANNTTADVVLSGVTPASFGVHGFNAIDFANMKQTSPVFATDSYGGTDTTPDISLNSAFRGVVVSVLAHRNANVALDSNITVTHVTSLSGNQGSHGYQEELLDKGVSYTHSVGIVDSSNRPSACSVAFESELPTETAEVYPGFIVGGFSALSKGKEYFLSNTAGEISTVAGSNKKKIGIAVSSSEIYLLR